MNSIEIQCAECGETFIFRKTTQENIYRKNASTPRFCPICSKNYRMKKERERAREEDEKWRTKKAEEYKQYEEVLKDWQVVTLDEAVPKPEDHVLYVIGNGFDLMHGARSSYYDFDKTIGKNSSLRFYLENYLEIDDLWADFEGALARINIEMMCSPFILDMWLDDMEAFDEDDGAAEFFMAAEMAAAPAVSLATDLTRRFEDWISKLKTNTDDRPLKTIIKQDSRFLNFNYTEFVEELYGVREENICYIHGCRRKKKGCPKEKLILGHMPGASDLQYDFEDRYSGVPQKHTQMVYDAQQTALRFVAEADEELTKNCDEIIKKHKAFFEGLSEINRIYTIGHSLYPVDWDYFKEILLSVKDQTGLQWYIGCHGKGDLDRSATFINHFSIRKEQVHIFRTDMISVTFKDPVAPIKDSSKKTQRKTLGQSDDGKWEIVSEGLNVDIADINLDKRLLRRVFPGPISGVVFTHDGNNLFLVIRGLYEGIFLLRFADGEWKFIDELEGIPNQGVITKRLQRILIDDKTVTFVYNSRVRKYDLSDGRLVYNKGIQKANERTYFGEDITDRFRNVYRRGFY